MTGIKHLAQRLDVSIGTVSRALNGRPGVNPETRARVLRLAAETGYVANALGRSLRRGATNTIGLVIETDAPSTLGGDDFFIALADAMQPVMAARGYDLVLLPCRRAGDPVDPLRRIVHRGTVDAVVITATRRRDPRIDLLLRSRLPFLLLGRSGTPGDYDWIDLDFEGMARAGVGRLAALGHRRVAVGVPAGDVNWAHLFHEAAARALAAAGLRADPALMVRAPPTEDGGRALAGDLLGRADPPTAAMLCSDALVAGFYAGLAAAGLRPGRDVSVLGFRDRPQLRVLAPPPSCFHLALDALGVVVAETILDVTARQGRAAPARVLWPMDLRETASIGPPPG